MKPVLVNLHIPKSAGTSQRGYLFQVYGEEKVFWYGLHSDSREFDPQEVGSAMALGGHRRISFYPEGFEALFLSVIRDPIERVVSYFNYCTSEPGLGSEEWRAKRLEELQYWRDVGVDPDSIVRSIENSEAFRVEISNLQCDYLSRHGATFSGVLETMDEENIVIGVFERLSLFDSFLRQELNFPLENKQRANVGREGYAGPLLSEPGVVDVIRKLTVEDQKLYDFVRYEKGGLYVGTDILPAVRDRVPSVSQRSNLAGNAARFDWGKVHLYCKGLMSTNAADTMVIALVIKNGGNENVIFSKTDDAAAAIGWMLLDSAGLPVAGGKGICHIDNVVQSRELTNVVVMIEPDQNVFRSAGGGMLEFSVVADGEWKRDQYPLNGAWVRLQQFD